MNRWTTAYSVITVLCFYCYLASLNLKSYLPCYIFITAVLMIYEGIFTLEQGKFAKISDVSAKNKIHHVVILKPNIHKYFGGKPPTNIMYLQDLGPDLTTISTLN